MKQLLALLLLTSLVASAEPSLRGVAIGISEYQSYRFWGPVHGVEDATAFGDALRDRYGARDLRLVLGKQATGPNILAALEKLVAQCQPGDTVVVYYSGHGSVVADQPGGDEEDGLDECLVPYDAPSQRSQKFAAAVIRDDDFHQLIARMAERVGSGGQVVLVFDSCHSGTMNRACLASGLVAKTAASDQVSQDGAMAEDLPAGVAVLSACQADELAADDQRRGGGVFTAALVRSLLDARLGPDSDYRLLMNRIQRNGNFVEQNPRFEGDFALPVLGGRAQARQTQPRLVSLPGWIDRGESGGYYAGSRVRLGQLEGTVEEATAFRARVRFDSQPGQQALGQPVELVSQNAGPSSLKVFPLDPTLALPAAVTRVEQADQADLVVEVSGQQVLLYDRHGRKLRLPAGQLENELARLQTRHYLGRLVHRPELLRLEVVAGTFASLDPIGGFRPGQPKFSSQGWPSLRAGVPALVKMSHRAAHPMYLELLSFGTDGRVHLLRSSGLLKPGQEWQLALTFDPEGDFPEGLKLVASRTPLDLSGVTRANPHPLGPYLRETKDGLGSRSDSTVDPADANSYAVGEVVFIETR
ncbi:MAG: caspase family protein [Candidatus Eremiobacteraeota bacterium]|nr:caspase family protein [Candidatus Eremiobacteraeota bacterium]